MPACDASSAPVTPPRAGDRAGVRREPRAGDAAARRGPGRRATRAARRRRRRPLVTRPACDTTCAPVTPLPAGDPACGRCEPRARPAAARCRPGRRATRAARRARLRPLPTMPACDASSAPELRRPLLTRPATEPACPPQSTAQPCCIHTTLSAPCGFRCLRRSRTSYESGASHQASFASDWHAQRASGASHRAKKNPALCQGAGQWQQRRQFIRRRWAAWRSERPRGRRSDTARSS